MYSDPFFYVGVRGFVALYPGYVTAHMKRAASSRSHV